MTAGEVMQLTPDDELVLVSGCAPIRAKKARYFEDQEMQARILSTPKLTKPTSLPIGVNTSVAHEGDWAGQVVEAPSKSAIEDPANAGIRREPELPEYEEVVPEPKHPVHEFDPMDEEPDDEVQRQRIMQRTFRTVARQVSLDPGDDMQM
jgi:type IV secretion system protein VirD4